MTEIFRPVGQMGSSEWTAHLLRADLSNKGLVERIAKLHAEIGAFIDLKPRPGFGIFPIVEAPLNSQDAFALALGLVAHRLDNPITRIEQVMRVQGGDGHLPNPGEDHLDAIYQVARQIPRLGFEGMVLISGAELSSLANYHPRLGYYRQEYGVARISEDDLASAFITPLESDERYRRAYGAAIDRAYNALSLSQEFTPQDPFTIVLVGDGEGKILDQIIQRIKAADAKSLYQVLVIDSSQFFLDKQKSLVAKDELPIEFWLADGRRIGDILNRLGMARGVIIAGEELVDDFPSYAVGWNYREQLGEYVMVIRKKDYFQAFLPIELINPGLGELIDPWLAAFPHYREHLKTLPLSRGQDFFSVPLNVDLLTMMLDIARSGFKGYWMGGDYCGYFQHSSWPDFPAVRAMPVLSPGQKLELRYAMLTACNVSADVDPALFAFSQALGPRLDYMGRPGHFMTALLANDILSKEEVFSIAKEVAQDLSFGHMPSKKYLIKIFVEMMALWEYFTGSRFNWVVATGDDVPPFFPPDLISKIW